MTPTKTDIIHAITDRLDDLGHYDLSNQVSNYPSVDDLVIDDFDEADRDVLAKAITYVKFDIAANLIAVEWASTVSQFTGQVSLPTVLRSDGIHDGDGPMKTRSQTTTERVETHEINLSDLLTLLEIQGDPKGSNPRAYVRIPGGGDYSNQTLDLNELVGGCVYLSVTYTETNQS